MAVHDLIVSTAHDSPRITSVKLFDQELLDTTAPCQSELWVNGQPLALRPHVDPHDTDRKLLHLKGERFTNFFSGWALVVARRMGHRTNLKHPCFGIETVVRREQCDQTCPCPGPGGPVTEAPLWAETFSILNWNWKFWGDDTRMIFPTIHGGGPADEFGHVGYDHDTPEVCKNFMQNIRRRIYPGSMVIHGGLFYNVKTANWIAITCRRPNLGYNLNINDAGRGISYDFTLHAMIPLGETLPLPEIKIYYGKTREQMMTWLADYTTNYYEEPPEWVFKTVFGGALAWNNQPTWSQQADHWEKQLDDELYSGIDYCLVTSRPIQSGTTPYSYEPDPNHGSIQEFKKLSRRMADRKVPLLIWMSHSGLMYRGSPDIDDDWFIRGIDGRISAAWGSVDNPDLAHVNPGHPGYIEYTKKWIRFYIGECGCKGIFLDCLAWAFPTDYTPRKFMRYPGDTNRMAIKFIDEIYACIKECDPEAILLGEGATLEAPCNVVALHTNPQRAIDGFGPRDFMLQLNSFSSKRIVIDQGPWLFPASGYCHADNRREGAAQNRQMVQLLRERGAPKAFTHLPGDLSVLDDLLFVPVPETKEKKMSFKLPASLKSIRVLTETTSQVAHKRADDHKFHDVPPGVYRMQ